MKHAVHVLLLVTIGIALSAGDAAAELSTKQRIDRLMQVFTQTEAQLERSIHYVEKDNADGVATIQQAWFDGANNLLKVAVERSGPSGRELTEYFAGDFESYTMFILTRKETPVDQGEIQVDESRQYFVEGDLVRELRKSGRFKAGDSLDTVKIPNVTVDLAKRPKDQLSEEKQIQANYDFFSKPTKIAAGVSQAGPPDTNFFAAVKGESEKFRVIHRTASPDGRYAIALGFARKQINWDDFVEKPEGTTPPTYYAEDEKDLRNYVVDLVAQKILGATGCNYFGTRAHYNHRECSVSWSSDSSRFVQLWSDKWEYTAFVAGQIGSGPKLVGVTNLGKLIETKTYSFLKKRADSMPGLTIFLQQVSNDGAIEIRVDGVHSSGDRKGETAFSLSERLRLRQTPAGLRSEIVSIRRLPNEP